MDFVVALRTHVWNDCVDLLARRMQGSFSNSDLLVIADETKGKINTGKFKKISHTDDFSDFNLPKIPQENSLWYNGDYPLYKLRREFPDTNYFIMIENDVMINFDLDRIIDYVKLKNIDMVVHDLIDAKKNWYHFKSLCAFFENPKKCLFPFIIISGRAIDVLYKKRIEISQNIDNMDFVWPYCEGFIPSTICEYKNFLVEDLGKFCNTENYDFFGCRHYLDPEINKINSISHPVRGNDFISRRIHEDGVSSFFDRSSILRKSTRFLPKEFFYEILRENIIKSRNIDNIISFNDISLQEGWILKPEPMNISLSAEATQSSISEYSIGSTVKDDAMRAIDGNLDKNYAFHTSFEENPWWIMTFPKVETVRHIIIYNRNDYKERAKKLYIELSTDGIKWDVISSFPEGIIFGGSDGYPLVIKVDNKVCKHIKIGFLGRGILHLKQIEVYKN